MDDGAYADAVRRVLIAGGTGTAGSPVVDECLRRGYQTRVVSRRAPAPGSARWRPGVKYLAADVMNDVGLREAVDGTDIYRNSVVPGVVVRATQFHDLVNSAFQTGAKAGVIPVFRGAVFQSIAVREVAAALLDAADSPSLPAGGLANVAGPETLTMEQMARIYRDVTGTSGRILTVPLPGPLGRSSATATPHTGRRCRRASVRGLATVG